MEITITPTNAYPKVKQVNKRTPTTNNNDNFDKLKIVTGQTAVIASSEEASTIHRKHVDETAIKNSLAGINSINSNKHYPPESPIKKIVQITRQQ